MVLEQVLSDQDSEDEVDDDVADFEDRRVYNSLSLSLPPLSLQYCLNKLHFNHESVFIFYF